MSEFVPDFHRFQNFWIEQQKKAIEEFEINDKLKLYHNT